MDKRLDNVKLLVTEENKPIKRSLNELLESDEDNTVIVYWFFDLISTYRLGWMPDEKLTKKHVSSMLDVLEAHNIDYTGGL